MNPAEMNPTTSTVVTCLSAVAARVGSATRSIMAAVTSRPVRVVIRAKRYKAGDQAFIHLS
jgi:hypothetical protein